MIHRTGSLLPLLDNILLVAEAVLSAAGLIPKQRLVLKQNVKATVEPSVARWRV